MTEKLLQFIWRFQYFNTQALQTETGESLLISKQGLFNLNQGPDFLEATVKIEEVILVGNIEIHVRSSDWNKHGHSADKNFSNIILHVVWDNDAEIKDGNGSILPTLSLQNRIPKILLQSYQQLMEEASPIACQNFLPALSDLGWLAWKERLAIERLKLKSDKILGLFEVSNHHWEEVFWWITAANFGIKVNAELFEQVARSIPLTILGKHKNQIHQIEALLCGQAHLLDDEFKEDYPQLLQREYLFLQKKYHLSPVNATACFLRMRPANFPTLRLAQLAMLIYNGSHLFSKMKEFHSLKEAKELFDITCNDYWHYHYLFDEPSSFKPKHLGIQMINNIFINAVIPVLFAYGLYTNDQKCKDKAIGWLGEIKAEENSITRSWQVSGIKKATALDSQALIQLRNHYCQNKLCLECAVGNKILKTKY
jgi:hypothetical protein